MRRRDVWALPAALALLLTACAGPAGARGTPSPSGDTPGQATSQQPLQATPGPLVRTDWSKLDTASPAKEQYNRWYDTPTDRLLPVSGGYGGELIPFIGEELKSSWSSILKYGLAMADRTLVCDPVYSSARIQDGYLLLQNADRVGENSWGTAYRTTVAAPDGSWVLPEEYRNVWFMEDGRLLLLDGAGVLWFCGGDGALTLSPLNETLSAHPELASAELTGQVSFQNGLGFFHDGTDRGNKSGSWLLNAVTGEVRYLPEVLDCWGWSVGAPLAVGRAADGRCGYLDRNGDWVIPPQFRWAGEFEGNCALVEREEGGYALIDRKGRVTAESAQWLNSRQSSGGEVFYLEMEWSEGTGMEQLRAVYDGDGQLLADHPLIGKEMECAFGAAMTREGDTMTFWDYDGAVLGTLEDSRRLGLSEYENAMVQMYDWWTETCGLYDLETGEWVVPIGNYNSIGRFTDEKRTVRVLYPKEWAGAADVVNEDGTVITRVAAVSDFCSGVLCVRDGGYYGFIDLEGNWVFRWEMRTNSD